MNRIIEGPEAHDLLRTGQPMEYRRTPFTDWMDCAPNHQFNAYFEYRLKAQKEQ